MLKFASRQMPAGSQAAAAAATALLLAACAAPPRTQLPASAPEPIPLDASYDWHVLLLAPFGSVLKDIRLPLHEVLLFRDDAQNASAAEEAECYAVAGAAPRFIARVPEDYLLCFKHDRLSRIEATVRLPASEAAQDFADACGLWLKNAAAAAAAPDAAVCEGSEADIEFRGSLETEPEGADALLSIKLEHPAGRPP
jgi:hypothetical protein